MGANLSLEILDEKSVDWSLEHCPLLAKIVSTNGTKQTVILCCILGYLLLLVHYAVTVLTLLPP